MEYREIRASRAIRGSKETRVGKGFRDWETSEFKVFKESETPAFRGIKDGRDLELPLARL